MKVSETIELMLAELSVSKSEKTVRTYRTALTRFLGSCGDKQALDLNLRDIITFAQELSGVATSTRQTYLAAVARLYRWLALEGVNDIDLGRLQARLRDLRGPAPKRLPRLPKNGDAETVIETARALPPGNTARRELTRLRNIAIIETLRSTGARVSEVVSLTRGNLDHFSRTATVIGKGDKERTIFFDDAAWSAVHRYMEVRDVDSEDPRGLSPWRPVFARHDRRVKGIKSMSATSIRNVLADLCELAGVERLTPHQFRHRFATAVLSSTGDLAVTQELLGHSTPTTTRGYAQVANERKLAAHRATDL